MWSQKVVLDATLLRRYDVTGPRYTSYPTAVQFHDKFCEAHYRAAVMQGNAEWPRRSLSLYFHIPFCNTVCLYCACNKIVTRNRGRAAPYLESVFREIELQGALFDRNRVVKQLHWGGGTPTFLSDQELTQLMANTRRHFTLLEDDQGDYSIEIDPRELRAGTLGILRRLGFNRLSMGVQDFDPAVQQAVNRIQSEDQTMAVLHEARALGFRSINMDLIYGLPRQTLESFGGTLEKIIAAGPDRLSVFNYAHLPDLFKMQRQINAAELPGPQAKLDILQLTIERLTQAGYLYVGMDHFARPDDELAIAQRNGTLYRNFQGYSTHSGCDVVGMGVTAIGTVGNTYSQNVKTIPAYSAMVAAGKLPLQRGIELDHDDLLRRAVITGLMCHFRLDLIDIERRFNVSFNDYFLLELSQLSSMAHDGLLHIGPDEIVVEPAGKLLIRNICMVFDKYLRQKQLAPKYSRVV